MADKEREDGGPSLEMPTLRGMFRRRKRRKDADEPAHDRPATSTDATTRPLFADDHDPAPGTTVTRIVEPEARPEERPEQDDDAPPRETRRERRERRGPILAGLPPRLVAVVTGALVGLLAVGLTYVGLVGCEAWRGTQSCGGPGLLFLALILAAMVLVGAFLLRAAGVRDATSTSGLGVGIFAVVCLLALVDELFSPWMLVVLPVVGAVGFVVAHWVTASYGSPAPSRD